MDVIEAEKAFAHIDRPFACINLDALDQNIDFVNNNAQGKGIRVATKSVRSKELLEYIAERLVNHSGWMTFDLHETLYLLEEGFDDLLLGYPQLEDGPMDGIVQHIQRGRTVVFMVDSLGQWRWLEKLGKHYNIVLDVCFDLNVSTDFKVLYFGTKRSSLRNVADLKKLLEGGRLFTHTKITGVMGYEAQIAGVADIPLARWQGPLIRKLKKKSLKHVRKFRKEAVDVLRERVPDLRFVNGGGSGSIDFTAGEAEVTELTIGSAFYFPALFSRFSNLPLQESVNFALRVTRNPEPHIIVCHGGGYIASGTTGDDKNPVPVWPEQLSYLKNEGAGEVQTPLLDKTGQLDIGDTVYFRHAKAGELCERFSELHARRGANYKGAFTTYRGEGGCFL